VSEFDVEFNEIVVVNGCSVRTAKTPDLQPAFCRTDLEEWLVNRQVPEATQLAIELAKHSEDGKGEAYYGHNKGEKARSRLVLSVELHKLMASESPLAYHLNRFFRLYFMAKSPERPDLVVALGQLNMLSPKAQQRVLDLIKKEIAALHEMLARPLE